MFYQRSPLPFCVAFFPKAVMTLEKDRVHKVKACLLNKVTWALSFRHPMAILRAISQGRHSSLASMQIGARLVTFFFLTRLEFHTAIFLIAL